MRANIARGKSRGQSLVEFALVLPLFLLLVFGIMDLGLAVLSYNSITNAAREGVRLAIVNQDATNVTSKATSQARVARTPTVTVAYYQAKADGTPDTTKTCPIGASSFMSARLPTHCSGGSSLPTPSSNGGSATASIC